MRGRPSGAATGRRRRPWAASLLVPLVACSPAAPPQDIALVHATVIDGTGAPPRLDQTLLVRDGVITDIGPFAQVDTSGAARIVDTTGKHLIPGLWDAHAHTAADPVALDLYLAHGVTSVRDMGCDPACTARLVRWRDEVASGSRRGTRLLVAGPNVDGPKPLEYAGHVNVTAETAGTAVAELAALGIDFVKVRDWLSAEQYRAVVEAAAARGLPVDGHIPVAVPVPVVLGSGQRTIEHGGSALGGLLMAASSAEDDLRAQLLAALDAARQSGSFAAPFEFALGPEFSAPMLGSFHEQRAEAIAAAMAAAGTALVPTLVVSEPTLQAPDPVFDGRRLLADDRMRFASVQQIEAWQRNELFGNSDQSAMVQRQEKLCDLVLRIKRAGAPVLAGTDMSDEGRWQIAGISLHDEMLLLVRAGLSPMEAIVAATAAPARAFGRDDLGTLQVGRRADVVILDADPLADIRSTRRIAAVMTAGEYLDRPALDGILDKIAAR